MLILGANGDHFIDYTLIGREINMLKNVRSLTFRLFTDKEDAQNHCNAEDVTAFGKMVSSMRSYNPDNTVARSDPGWNELFSFEIKFKEYLEMKNKNVKTEDVLRELEQPERVRGQRR